MKNKYKLIELHVDLFNQNGENKQNVVQTYSSDTLGPLRRFSVIKAIPIF